MKKILLAAAICAASATSLLADTDVFDVSLSCKCPYVTKNCTREYKSTSLKGTLYFVYDDEGKVCDAYAILKDSVMKTTMKYDVEIINGSVCGKKMECANITLNFISEGDMVDFTYCGNGTLKQVVKGTCNFCTAGTADCYKATSISGNLTGIIYCPPEGDYHTVDLTKCGPSCDENGCAAMWGSGSIKWNKKSSVY